MQFRRRKTVKVKLRFKSKISNIESMIVDLWISTRALETHQKCIRLPVQLILCINIMLIIRYLHNNNSVGKRE